MREIRPGFIKRTWEKRPILIYRTVVLVALLIGWESLIRTRLIDTFFLASPTQILSCFGTVLKRPDILRAFQVTFSETLIAWGLASIFGFTLGTIVGLSDPLFHSAYGILLMLYGIPKLTIIPLFILYLGIGMNCRIAFGAVSGFFPILLNTIAGARSIEPSIITMSHAMGATRFQRLTKIVFPSILPNAFTGLKIGMNHTLLGVLLAELFFSQKGGIGYHINLLTSTFKTDQLFAIIAAVAAGAIFANEGLRRLEKRFSVWREV